MTFFGPSMTEKTMVEVGGGKFRGVAGYGGRSGAERCAFLSYTYARVCEALALTEPERLHCRLRLSELERSIDGC